MKYKIWGLTIFCFCWFCLAIYGGCQLWMRADRLDLIENQKQEIANLRTKITFLEGTDWALAIQAMSEMERDELSCLNEAIKQKKAKDTH